ncbi:MAG: guanylate kinase [Patescibacteria group bacterium]|nr:guanylate kinase [Patescibacteria group bacterium]
MKSKNKLFIISGPSGAGEDSIIEGLKKFLPIERVITTTTRKKRSDVFLEDPYYFISQEEFEKGITENRFLEYAQEYNNQFYGVTEKEIRRVIKSGRIGIWKIEYKGVITMKKLMPEVVAIFITVSSLKILKQRLLQRGASEEFIKERMEYTREWLKHKDIYDYEVINHEGKLDEAIDKVRGIILKETNENL